MPACSKGAQERRDLLEQAAVSGTVAILSPRHQNGPIRLAGGPRLTCVTLLVVADPGQRRQAAVPARWHRSGLLLWQRTPILLGAAAQADLYTSARHRLASNFRS